MKRPQIPLATITILFAATPIGAQQPKSIFYLTRDPKSVRSFLAHADKIDLLSPGWYSVDASGLLSGGPNPLIVETARQHHIPVIPLVVNGGFAQEEVHKFFANGPAKENAIYAMIRASKENGYIGFQLDMENVKWTDRDALSDFVREAGAAFQKERLQLSITPFPYAPRAPS